MRLKPIEWQRKGLAVRGFVEGVELFSYREQRTPTRYVIISFLPGVEPENHDTPEDCERAARGMFRRFIQRVME